MVDMTVHKSDAAVLSALGASDVPRAMLIPFPRSSAPDGYVDVTQQGYWSHLKRGQNPHSYRIDIVHGFSAPHGWQLVTRASGVTRARMSQHFLETSAFSKCGTVTFGHTTQTQKYPQVEVVNPAVWSFLRSGLVEAAGQLVSVEMLATQRERLRALPSHPFTTWQRGIEGLVACIPSDDYSTLPAKRQKRAADDERPFWVALSSKTMYQWMRVGPFTNGWRKLVGIRRSWAPRSGTLI